jgi:hypothetical protein
MEFPAMCLSKPYWQIVMETEKSAKEFVKFNERCMILIIGDMRPIIM